MEYKLQNEDIWTSKTNAIQLSALKCELSKVQEILESSENDRLREQEKRFLAVNKMAQLTREKCDLEEEISNQRLASDYNYLRLFSKYEAVTTKLKKQKKFYLKEKQRLCENEKVNSMAKALCLESVVVQDDATDTQTLRRLLDAFNNGSLNQLGQTSNGVKKPESDSQDNKVKEEEDEDMLAEKQVLAQLFEKYKELYEKVKRSEHVVQHQNCQLIIETLKEEKSVLEDKLQAMENLEGKLANMVSKGENTVNADLCEILEKIHEEEVLEKMIENDEGEVLENIYDEEVNGMKKRASEPTFDEENSKENANSTDLVVSLQDDLVKSKSESSKMKEQLNEMERLVDESNDQVDALKIDSLNNNNKQLVDELETWKNKVGALQTKIDSLHNNNDQLVDELNISRNQVSLLGAEIDSSSNNLIEQLTYDLNTSKREIVTLRAEIDSLNHNLNSSQHDKLSLETQVKELREELKVLKDQLETQASTEHKNMEELKACKSYLENSEKEKETLREKILCLEAVHNSSLENENVIKRLEREMEELNEKLKEMTRIENIEVKQTNSLTDVNSDEHIDIKHYPGLESTPQAEQIYGKAALESSVDQKVPSLGDMGQGSKEQFDNSCESKLSEIECTSRSEPSSPCSELDHISSNRLEETSCSKELINIPNNKLTPRSNFDRTPHNELYNRSEDTQLLPIYNSTRCSDGEEDLTTEKDEEKDNLKKRDLTQEDAVRLAEERYVDADAFDEMYDSLRDDWHSLQQDLTCMKTLCENYEHELVQKQHVIEEVTREKEELMIVYEQTKEEMDREIDQLNKKLLENGEYSSTEEEVVREEKAINHPATDVGLQQFLSKPSPAMSETCSEMSEDQPFRVKERLSRLRNENKLSEADRQMLWEELLSKENRLQNALLQCEMLQTEKVAMQEEIRALGRQTQINTQQKSFDREGAIECLNNLVDDNEKLSIRLREQNADLFRLKKENVALKEELEDLNERYTSQDELLMKATSKLNEFLKNNFYKENNILVHMKQELQASREDQKQLKHEVKRLEGVIHDKTFELFHAKEKLTHLKKISEQQIVNIESHKKVNALIEGQMKFIVQDRGKTIHKLNSAELINDMLQGKLKEYSSWQNNMEIDLLRRNSASSVDSPLEVTSSG